MTSPDLTPDELALVAAFGLDKPNDVELDGPDCH